jgi:hypothetical protein
LYNIIRDLLKVNDNNDEEKKPQEMNDDNDDVDEDDNNDNVDEEEEDDQAPSYLEESLIQRYTVSHRIKSLDKLFTKSVRILTSRQDITPFAIAAESLCDQYHDAIINDQVIYPSITPRDALSILKNHLFNHVVNFSHGSQANYYTQVKGIPQGSILSPILCNFYYGNIENNLLGDLENLNNSHNNNNNNNTNNKNNNNNNKNNNNKNTNKNCLKGSDKYAIIRLMDDYLVKLI